MSVLMLIDVLLTRILARFETEYYILFVGRGSCLFEQDKKIRLLNRIDLRSESWLLTALPLVL